MAAECLKPWPEQGDATTTRSEAGWKSMTKSSSAVRVVEADIGQQLIFAQPLQARPGQAMVHIGRFFLRHDAADLVGRGAGVILLGDELDAGHAIAGRGEDRPKVLQGIADPDDKGKALGMKAIAIFRLEPVDQLTIDADAGAMRCGQEVGDPSAGREDQLVGAVAVFLCVDRHSARADLVAGHFFAGVDDRAIPPRQVELGLDAAFRAQDAGARLVISAVAIARG